MVVHSSRKPFVTLSTSLLSPCPPLSRTCHSRALPCLTLISVMADSRTLDSDTPPSSLFCVLFFINRSGTHTNHRVPKCPPWHGECPLRVSLGLPHPLVMNKSKSRIIEPFPVKSPPFFSLLRLRTQSHLRFPFISSFAPFVRSLSNLLSSAGSTLLSSEGGTNECSDSGRNFPG